MLHRKLSENNSLFLGQVIKYPLNAYSLFHKHSIVFRSCIVLGLSEFKAESQHKYLILINNANSCLKVSDATRQARKMHSKMDGPSAQETEKC